MRTAPLSVDAAAPGCLYVGRVMHQRFAPRGHRLAYRIFSCLFDIDRLDALAASSRLFSRNRFNLYSFHDRDHGDGSARPLRAQVEALLARAGLTLGDGRVRLLCMPRVLGYAFNPLSVYFCYQADGKLIALIHEVNNTFGQRHTYVMPLEKPAAADALVVQSCLKRFHVSPFIGMEMRYGFRVSPPTELFALLIDVSHAAPDAATTPAAATVDALEVNASQARTSAPAASPSSPRVLTALYTARRRAFTDAALLRVFVTHPLLTLKVIVGIHWEALLLWRKGARYHPCPAAGANVTIVTPSSQVS
ncbi:MAG: DUF1365 domain-containing protein [Janthinobacterium lividum]